MATRTHVSGEMDNDTSDAALDSLFEELDAADAEHPDVSVADESEWSLSVFGTGRVVWENVVEGRPRHMTGVGRHEARRLLGLVASGQLAEVERMEWRPGYGG